MPVIRAELQDITALGAAMIAGQAKGIDVWDLNDEFVDTVPTHTFLPTTTENGKCVFVIPVTFWFFLFCCRTRWEIC